MRQPEVKLMKFKVTKRFRDRFTMKIYEEDSVYETDDKKRAEFLKKEGYIGAEIKEKKSKKDDKS
jgi:hypothetical protein